MRRIFNLAEWAINHRSFVTFFMIMLLAAGAWSYTRLGRAEDPPFTVKDMIVQAQWPGATISDTLLQVTEKIEKKVQETPYLDHVTSYTLAGRATIRVALKGSVPPKSVPDIWYQVRKKVDDIRWTLPQGVIGPTFNDEFGDTYSIIYGVFADGFTHRELRDYVEGVRSRLLLVQDVNKVDIIGAQDERLYLEVSAQQTSGLLVDRTELVRALQAQNAVAPAGVVRTAKEDIHVRVSGGFGSESDLRRVNLVSHGQLVRLSDVGTVTRAYADPPQRMFRVNGKPAIALGISMREGGNALALGDRIKREMASITAGLPIGIEPILVADQPTVVSHAVGDFMRSLEEALVIVIAISFLSLGFRAGAVVALSIPVVLAVVFVFMDLSDIALQRVSLGALIISLGLLVDDAMITVEMMIRKLEEGWTKTKAATYAYMTTHFPMGTGTLVTVAAFLPIGMAQSSAGEYLFSLFAVVAVALIASWFVAAIFTPLLGVVLLSEKQRSHHRSGWVMRAFREILLLCMRWRRVTVAVACVAFVLAMVGLTFVPRQFFPSADRPELFVDMQLPQNASIVATEKVVYGLERLLRDDRDIERWSTYIGQGAIRFYLPMLVQLPNNSFAQAVVLTKNLDARERVRARIERAFQEQFPEVVGRVYPLEMGMPVGWPVQYRVSGPDTGQVRKIAYQVASLLTQSSDVRNVNFDWIETGKTLRIKVDQDQARLLNLSSESLAQALEIVVSGVTVTQIRDGIHLIDVVMRGPEQERVSLDSLGTLQIPLPNGRTVPLLQVAAIEYGQELPLIRRRDRLPTLTVQGDVAPGVQPETAVGKLRSKIAALDASLPAGYKVEVGGVAEESARSQRSLMAEVPLMAILLLAILMVQLQSFRRILLVLSVAPLGFIGVVTALLVTGKPLGFVALVGVIALVGMDVRNSIVLMVQIDAEIAEGRNPWDAVVAATMHRFRPILLTASAAALGMVPIISTVFWGPFAIAVIGGLTVATMMTLTFLPALYVLWFRVKEPFPQETSHCETVPVAVARTAVAGNVRSHHV
jgi:multidrug efflux pump subunit AcrB